MEPDTEETGSDVIQSWVGSAWGGRDTNLHGGLGGEPGKGPGE